MKSITFLSLVLFLSGVCAIPAVVHAGPTDADEAAVQKEEMEIDKVSGPKDSERVESLVKQYGAEKTQVEALRGKTGWGGTTIQLSMAQNLMKTDPTTYPTMNEALAKIESLRAEGKGYGAIAKDLGFKLGPVVSDAQHTRNDLRKAEKSPKPETMKHEKPPKAERMQKPPKAERPPKPDRPNKH